MQVGYWLGRLTTWPLVGGSANQAPRRYAPGGDLCSPLPDTVPRYHAGFTISDSFVNLD